MVREEQSPGPAGAAVLRRQHLPYFDGLRAEAAVLVFLFHAHGRSPSHVGWFTYLLPGIRGMAHVFFVLSAFLLYRPWAVHHLDGGSAPSLRHFAKGRVLRVLPAYWVALVVVSALGLTGVRTGFDWLTHLTLTQVYASSEPFKGLVVDWTLAVEVVFYLGLPFYAAAVGALGRRLGVVRTEVGGVVALLAVGVAFQFWSVHTHRWLAQYWMPFFLPSFAVGILLAVAYEASARAASPHPLPELVARATWLWVALAALCYWRAASIGQGFQTFVPSGTVQDQALFTLMAGLVMLPGVFHTDRPTWWHRFAETRSVVFVGTVSYGFYLWHVTIVRIVHDHVLGYTGESGNYWVLILVSFVLSVVVGAASWYLVERPALRWRRRPWRLRLAPST